MIVLNFIPTQIVFNFVDFIVGQGGEDGQEEFFGKDLLQMPSGKFQAPRSRVSHIELTFLYSPKLWQ